MRSTLIYDLPTRIFHWVFVSLFLTSFVIGKTVDDESVVFSYHMISGLLLGGLVLWRIFWGLFGSKHAQFTGFNLNPLHLKDYFFGILSGSKKRWSGHNPTSSWAAVVMLILALGLSLTGYLMTTGAKESFEDPHEFLANTFIVVVALHVAGVILHSVRHRDGIALSMIDGKKEIPQPSEEITSSRPIAATLLIAMIISGGIYLYKSFEPQNRTLKVFGQNLQLAEGEKNHQEPSQGDHDRDND